MRNIKYVSYFIDLGYLYVFVVFESNGEIYGNTFFMFSVSDEEN